MFQGKDEIIILTFRNFLKSSTSDPGSTQPKIRNYFPLSVQEHIAYHTAQLSTERKLKTKLSLFIPDAAGSWPSQEEVMYITTEGPRKQMARSLLSVMAESGIRYVDSLLLDLPQPTSTVTASPTQEEITPTSLAVSESLQFFITANTLVVFRHFQKK